MWFLGREDLLSFIEALKASCRVFGPMSKGSTFVFDEIKDPSRLVIDSSPTTLPPKRFFIPQVETLLRYKSGSKGFEVEPVLDDAEDTVIIGVHPCDIHGINLLDRVFRDRCPGDNYLKRRERVVIIGSECTPDDHCFCKGLGTMDVDTGYDLFLTPIDEGFLCRVGSDRGRRLLDYARGIRKAEKDENSQAIDFRRKKGMAFKKAINGEPSSLPLLYANSYDHPVWREKGEVCFGCGSCVMVCPTCYCFDMLDIPDLDLLKGIRVRRWDACMVKDFAVVAGGYNFRPTRAERLRHRMMRKFQYQVERYGGLFCVGCGRCGRACLVDIEPVDITNHLIG